jgi:hypothetical protein
VFGVVGAEATLPTDPLPALPGGGPVRLLSTSGPQAVVCDVDPEAFAVLREPTPDGLELLGEAANVHDQVVTGFVDGPVLPLGLGTVLPDDDAVIDLLTRHAESLDGELERVRGCGEWALTVHEAVPLARAEPAAPAAASGREYLQQRRAALDERDTRWQEQEHVAERIHTPLADLSLDSVTVAARPLEDADPPLLHAVYLVADSSHERFLATADAIAEEHPTLAVELTGPWPPYHFTALDLSDDATGATTTGGLTGATGGSRSPARLGNDATLVDVLDRVLDRGVTITGDVVLSVAGVDLVYLGVRLVLKGVEGDETW